MNRFLYALKQAYNSLKYKPGFVISIIITMGITVGTLLCVATLAYVLIYKPLPYPEQNQLYKAGTIRTHISGRTSRNDAFNYPSLINLYQRQSVFDETALIDFYHSEIISHTNQPTVATTYVTPEWFSIFNTPMALGRRFEQSEAIDRYNPVAVLSHATWQEQFDGREDILEQKLTVKGVSFRVVGVVAKSFYEPQIIQNGFKTDVWLPWDFNHIPESERQTWNHFRGSLAFVGKLKENIPYTQASEQLALSIDQAWRDGTANIEGASDMSLKLSLQPLKSVILGDSTKTIYQLLAAVIGLVLIACTNLSNLFLSNIAEKQQQLAIRAALGSNRKQIFKTLLNETGLLMLASVITAIFISSIGFIILQHYLLDLLPRINELSINAFTLSTAIVIFIFLSLFFAYLGYRSINYRDLNLQLKSSGKGTGVQVSKKVRQSLIITQIAIATILIFTNINLFKDAFNIINEPMNIEIDNIMSLELSATSYTQTDNDTARTFMNQLRQKLLQLPQVNRVTHGYSPLNGFSGRHLIIERKHEGLSTRIKEIDDHYFQFLQQTILEGNNFTDSDIKNQRRVAIINDVAAKTIVPEGSAIGSKISFGDNINYTVIGVVKSLQIPARGAPRIRSYIPTSHNNAAMLIQLKDKQWLSRAQIADIIKDIGSSFSVHEFQSLAERRTQLLFPHIATVITTGLLTLLTFFLVSIGLYGILSYTTQMRRFELGTRIAIGAKSNDIVKLVISNNSKPILIGAAISLIGLLILYLSFSQELKQYISLTLVPVYLLTLGLISFISLLSCYFPLRPIIKRPVCYSLRHTE